MGKLGVICPNLPGTFFLTELRFGACAAAGLPSEYVAWRRLRLWAALELRYYDCCVNSCICFLGKYAELLLRLYCDEPRYNAAGHPRRQFAYTPLIPQLQALFRDRDMIEKLGHRSRAEALHRRGVYHEIFDGETYRTLRNTRPDPDHDYCFFDNPEDLALGLSTDGFTLFKRRRRGLSTAWPINIVIYNLHPSIRTRLENVICVGAIPSPTQCNDMNSFLAPLLEELLLLERGVESVKAPPAGQPDDLLALKGHSGKVPCRTCYIQGVPYRYPRVTTYYTPLTLPGAERGFPPHMLFLRTHELLHLHYRQLEALDGQPARRAELATDLGINARPIFGRLKAIDLSTCTPYDIMHLLFENLVPNMIAHWTGKYKSLDQGTEHYELAPGVWTEIGRLTNAAARTIPSASVGTLPDISTDQNLYKAEAYSFWFQYIGPIVLQNRLAQPYYNHYMLAREIVIRCVQLKITDAQIDELERMIREWVADYERYYYQYNYERLRTCTLTIHALLHMPHYIRHTGPLCGSWAFVMERFCGRLLPAVKNRYQPYTHLDNYIVRRAQMQVVCFKYGLPRLARSTVKWRYEGGERLSQHEKRDPDFPNIILGRPMASRIPVDRRLRDLMTRYFNPVYNPDNERPLNEIRARIDYDNISSYGRFLERGRRAEADARDNSFVRFTALPDENASNNGPDRPYEEVFYGRLINIYRVEFIEDVENNVREPFLLARIKICKDTNGVDAALPGNTVEYRSLDTDELLHIELINAVVGRVPLNRNTWGIIDTSRDGARTQFRDGNDDSDSDGE
ncbi:Transposase family tnp2 [Ceratobasidium sp. AG-Ba]|nr:Transposase family tnp2 [Ceratobasidium sp. AG-Ba]